MERLVVRLIISNGDQSKDVVKKLHTNEQFNEAFSPSGQIDLQAVFRENSHYHRV
jgi:hypothetical protein